MKATTETIVEMLKKADSAFPVAVDPNAGWVVSVGITIDDFFAAAALPACISAGFPDPAKSAYDFAADMRAERRHRGIADSLHT